jgi:hypothetical protein
MPRTVNRSKNSTETKSANTKITSTNQQATTPVVVQQQPQSFGKTITDGIASGVGWGLGTSVVRSIFGGTTSTNTPVNSSIKNNTTFEKCVSEMDTLKKCMNENGSALCLNELEVFNKCSKENS